RVVPGPGRVMPRQVAVSPLHALFGHGFGVYAYRVRKGLPGAVWYRLPVAVLLKSHRACLVPECLQQSFGVALLARVNRLGEFLRYAVGCRLKTRFAPCDSGQ